MPLTTQTARPTASPTASPTAERARGTIVLALLFAVYLGLLIWTVLWKLEVPWVGDAGRRIIKLVPFVRSGGAGASKPAEVCANILIFMPFGVYLGLLAPAWPWWRIAGTVAAASAALEITQYVLAVGSTDMTDVISNTAGGLAGLGALAVARFMLRGSTARVMTRVCSFGTVLTLVVAALFIVASPVRHVPPGHTPGMSMYTPEDDG